ncbi:hypothetical protein RRG08_060231 [Elysia crispata]|uniref:Uncharacterized protein n=1 Tax=Elysia crispata TaxID=231223 RepID=A0AAE0ZX30_9GAST|nr:hypothetical protein RRG08_060231 [Elysia crispata]
MGAIRILIVARCDQAQGVRTEHSQDLRARLQSVSGAHSLSYLHLTQLLAQDQVDYSVLTFTVSQPNPRRETQVILDFVRFYDVIVIQAELLGQLGKSNVRRLRGQRYTVPVRLEVVARASSSSRSVLGFIYLILHQFY